jgi:hypothetical protein
MMQKEPPKEGSNTPRDRAGLMALSPERLAPRQVTREAAETPREKRAADQPKRGETGWRQPNRRDKVPISAFVEKQTLYNLKAFLAGTVSVAKQESVTMQDAIIEALRDYCIKYKLQGDPAKFVQ